jgi:hypothetical protein
MIHRIVEFGSHWAIGAMPAWGGNKDLGFALSVRSHYWEIWVGLWFVTFYLRWRPRAMCTG